MGIQKSFLEAFSTDELMKFIDGYVETNEILHVPGHPWELCDQLARFLGFGYDRTWSQEEINLLTTHYSKKGAEETAKLLPLRSPEDCNQRARAMGLKTTVSGKKTRKGCTAWMLWEFEILAKYYPIIGSRTAILLPDRSERACMKKAEAANIRYIEPTPWTDEELDLLQKYYPEKGSIMEDILPGKTRQQIRNKAKSLGLSAPAQEWTPEEDELLKKRYAQMGADVSDCFEGRRSRSSCASRAYALGLTCEKSRTQWSEAELAILDQNYSALGSKVSELLPGRSENSCMKMACKRNLRFRPIKPDARPSSVSRRTNRRDWSPSEDETLTRHYEELGTGTAALLPGRSKAACQSRARVLNLRKGRNCWTKREDAVLTEHYPQEGRTAFERLPHRSEEACRARLGMLGLVKRKATDETDVNHDSSNKSAH